VGSKRKVIIPIREGGCTGHQYLYCLAALPVIIRTTEDTEPPTSTRLTVLKVTKVPILPEQDISLFVEASLPGGLYTLTLFAGSYPDSIWGEDSQDAIAFYKDPSMTVPTPERGASGNLQFEVTLLPGGTALRYVLPSAQQVRLTLHDVLGREIGIVLDKWQAAGVHEITFDGSSLASGLYIYRLQAGDFNATGKMVLMK